MVATDLLSERHPRHDLSTRNLDALVIGSIRQPLDDSGCLIDGHDEAELLAEGAHDRVQESRAVVRVRGCHV